MHFSLYWPLSPHLLASSLNVSDCSHRGSLKATKASPAVASCCYCEQSCYSSESTLSYCSSSEAHPSGMLGYELGFLSYSHFRHPRDTSYSKPSFPATPFPMPKHGKDNADIPLGLWGWPILLYDWTAVFILLKKKKKIREWKSRMVIVPDQVIIAKCCNRI